MPMPARIYRASKDRHAVRAWPGPSSGSWYSSRTRPREIEPLMGWTSSGDTRQQLRLWFDTKEEAIAYAEREGIAYRVEEPQRGEAPDHVLLRQLQVQPRRPLDALTRGAAAEVRPRSSAG